MPPRRRLTFLGAADRGHTGPPSGIAPRLLGPSPHERIAALEARASLLAERDRLARDLHDSVGHVLTVTTLQAAAARELLDSDVEFARKALRTIEDSGRRAMDELDYVLALPRERDPGDRRAGPPPRTLADLDRLVAETRAAGMTVAVEVTGPVDQLPLSMGIRVASGAGAASGLVRGWGVVYILWLTAVSECVALLSLGLVRPWGEVFPRRIPLVGGLRVPPVAAAAAAATGAPLLLTVTWAYYRRRRGDRVVFYSQSLRLKMR